MEGEPSLYVGETSQLIQERTKEHWRGMRSKDERDLEASDVGAWWEPGARDPDDASRIL